MVVIASRNESGVWSSVNENHPAPISAGLDPLYVRGLESLRAQGGGMAYTANSVMSVNVPDSSSGYTIRSSSGVDVPVSRGVAELVMRNNAAAAASSQPMPLIGNVPVLSPVPTSTSKPFDYDRFRQLNRTASGPYGYQEKNPQTENFIREKALALDWSKPADMALYTIFYDPFGLRESIAATAVKLQGGTHEQAIKAAFEAGPVSFYREQIYNQRGFIAGATLSGGFYGIGGSAVINPAIGKAGDILFKGIMTYQAGEFAASAMESGKPDLSKALSLAASVGIYAGIRAGGNLISSRFSKEIETPVKVSYQEQKSIIAEEIGSYHADLASGRAKMSYISSMNPSKDIPNAVLIQRETAGGVVRTVLTQEGEYVMPPVGKLNLGKYDIIASRTLTLGTGITGEGGLKYSFLSKQKDLTLAFESSVKPIRTVYIDEKVSMPFNVYEDYPAKITIAGLKLEGKPYLKVITPADIEKTPLSRTFPKIDVSVKGMIPRDIASGKNGMILEPIGKFKIVPLGTETITKMAEISIIEESPKFLPYAYVYIPQIGNVKTTDANLIKIAQGPKEKMDTRLDVNYTPKDTQDIFNGLKNVFNPIQKDFTGQATSNAQDVMQGQNMAQAERQMQNLRHPERQLERQISNYLGNQFMSLRAPGPEKFFFKMPEDDDAFFRRLSRNGRMIFRGKSKKQRVRIIVNPRADPMAYRISQGVFGKATHPKPTKAVRGAFVKEFFKRPAGMVFGKFETKETKKGLKQIIKGGW